MPTAINYVEFTVSSVEQAKAFYAAAFGWTYTDYASDYCEFDSGVLKGGFTSQGEAHPGGPLVVLYDDDLEGCLARVQAAGGVIVEAIFQFPGGERFEFTDPDGYQLAVWRSR